jgi:hypothetical protein
MKIIRHFTTQPTHNTQYADTIKITKYLKALQHVSDHRGSIIRIFSLYTQKMVYVMQLASRLRTEQAVSKPV